MTENHSNENKTTKKNSSDMKFRMNQSSSFDMDSFNKTIQRPWTPLNKKVILPTDEEIESNPRSRSAKLRVAFKNIKQKNKRKFQNKSENKQLIKTLLFDL